MVIGIQGMLKEINVVTEGLSTFFSKPAHTRPLGLVTGEGK